MLVFLKQKFNLRFFLINLSLVIVFAILYKIQDSFMINHKDFVLKYGILHRNYNNNHYSNESSPFLYYLWYSLITQTTVGYAGTIDSKTGMPVSFLESPNNLFKFLNILQLLSVLFVLSIN
jgi:hypothetical protein